jgi:hypothetical protein
MGSFFITELNYKITLSGKLSNLKQQMQRLQHQQGSKWWMKLISQSF